MFFFDIETLGTDQDSVLLSAALVYVNPEEKPTYKQLLDKALFIKFDAREQVEHYQRTINKSTLEWWKKQPLAAKQKSFLPSEEDVTLRDGIETLHYFIRGHKDYKSSTIWARGGMDEYILHSVEKDAMVDTLFPFWNWRDVRTAVDLMSGSTDGYCEIDHPEFNPNDVIKHDPVHDICYDVMMVLYGKEK